VMEQDPDKINDIERQIEQRVFKEGEAYAASHKRSRAENKDRSASRERIKEMGLRTDAYQVGVRIVKDLTALERKAFLQDLELVVRILGSRQKDLFPEEAMRAEKREQRRKEAEAEANKGKAGAPDPDKNPRSDPAKGGAKPRVGKKGETGNVVQLQPPSGEQQQAEGQEGDAVLNGLTPETQAAQNAALNPDGKPKSQSQIAAEKMEAAKLSGAKLN
jgi:hypothetical protein